MWLKNARAFVCLVKVYTVQSNEVKRKSGRMLLVSLSYLSSILDQSSLAWLAGLCTVSRSVLREVSSLHLDV